MFMDIAVGRVHAGERDVIVRPSGYSDRRLGILFTHSVEAGAGAVDWMVNPVRIPLYQALTGAGFTILQPDLGGSATWASDLVMDRMDEASQYLRNLMGGQERVILVGLSMGGMNALNWASRNKGRVAGVVTIVPVLNLTDVHDNSGYGPIIDAAYGGSYTEQQFGLDRNPLTMARNARFAGLKLQTWYGSSDALCKPEFAAQFGSYVPLTQTRQFTGDHLAIPNADELAEMVSFLDSL